MENFIQQFMNIAPGYLSTIGVSNLLNVVYALAILLIGRWLARRATQLLERFMKKQNHDETLTSFIGNISYAVLLIVVVLAALARLGIETTSLVAILGAAGLAIGLALKNSLSNFASGVMMLLFRPLQIGNFVDAGGTSGTVDDINIFYTRMRTPDNKIITVPNSSIMDNPITNYSAESTRRIDLVIGVEYNADLKQVKQLLRDIVGADERILKDQETTIAVAELADSAINFVVRPWVNAPDYWATRFDLLENIKNALDEANIGIPYPQMDLHVHNTSAAS
ncbi:Small-conductance mechanosensitive channel [BD1-7 clade bacterium]|uniref:Small-conductance mechanosensitive channel n=1 Tax=BD1-7 clade bacterium TaxID=2029982 RepID=A0A5S9PT11_9GAMM|nr:Small-conductance mechanosensitive channel [BD1-7 clade bacterium]